MSITDKINGKRDHMKQLEHIFDSMIQHKLFGDMYNLLEMIKETAPQVYEKYHKLGREAMDYQEQLRRYPLL